MLFILLRVTGRTYEYGGRSKSREVPRRRDLTCRLLESVHYVSGHFFSRVSPPESHIKITEKVLLKVSWCGQATRNGDRGKHGKRKRRIPTYYHASLRYAVQRRTLYVARVQSTGYLMPTPALPHLAYPRYRNCLQMAELATTSLKIPYPLWHALLGFDCDASVG